MIKRFFGAEVEVKVDGPKQDGATDCGLYAIANSVSRKKPRQYQQHLMRHHFVKCIESGSFTLFD